MPPLILDFDRSVGAVDGATRIGLGDWQERIRFGCSQRRLRACFDFIAPQLPAAHGTVMLGSGDYHHLSWPLIERVASDVQFDVVVFDNHPDNMRFPWGIHCGSWVRRVALLPQVRKLRVLGISSGDVGGAHAWENYLAPLRRGKLEYWTVGVDVGWARRFGLGEAFHAFDSPSALLDRFVEDQHGATTPVYLSIDKDVLSTEVARTNWDQGRLLEADLVRGIDALAGRLIGSDITGEVSQYRYMTWWKRKLSALDAQPGIDAAQLAQWQAQQHALNLRLLPRIAAARR
ncbi:MAG: arginase family protein [Dokdonella sp.]|uniref:arginase family protein n=1 Tax=Dokdonella sp. TaxID=2291710 RepID=UPI0025B882D7|nr:arginase family protein [Dokdonella sp.]MBZ0223305.1 arginase family protein [Dokdonella sp.]MCC7256267.1 arginase family protein [Dokdonella sp.]